MISASIKPRGAIFFVYPSLWTPKLPFHCGCETGSKILFHSTCIFFWHDLPKTIFSQDFHYSKPRDCIISIRRCFAKQNDVPRRKNIRLLRLSVTLLRFTAKKRSGREEFETSDFFSPIEAALPSATPHLWFCSTRARECAAGVG